MENIPNIKNNRQELCIQQIEHFDENVLKHKSLSNNNKKAHQHVISKIKLYSEIGLKYESNLLTRISIAFEFLV